MQEKMRRPELLIQLLKIIEQEHGEVSKELVYREALSGRKSTCLPPLLHDLLKEFLKVRVSAPEVAKEWRLAKAAEIIRATKYTHYTMVNGEKVAIHTRAWLAEPSGQGRYIRRSKALSRKDARVEFIKRHISTLQSFCNESADVQELESLRAAVLGPLQKLREEYFSVADEDDES